MKTTAATLALTVSLIGIMTSFDVARGATALALVHVDVAIVAKGYRITELLGRAVYNDKNEKIGSLEDIMISQDGNAMFAILQVGGFLGLGGHLVAVPYKNLVMKEPENKFVLRGASKEALGALSEFKYTR
jgi:sporulation protein YlmC with PRC-barrel domain